MVAGSAAFLPHPVQCPDTTAIYTSAVSFLTTETDICFVLSHPSPSSAPRTPQTAWYHYPYFGTSAPVRTSLVWAAPRMDTPLANACCTFSFGMSFERLSATTQDRKMVSWAYLYWNSWSYTRRDVHHITPSHQLNFVSNAVTWSTRVSQASPSAPPPPCYPTSCFHSKRLTIVSHLILSYLALPYLTLPLHVTVQFYVFDPWPMPQV